MSGLKYFVTCFGNASHPQIHPHRVVSCLQLPGLQLPEPVLQWPEPVLQKPVLQWAVPRLQLAGKVCGFRIEVVGGSWRWQSREYFYHRNPTTFLAFKLVDHGWWHLPQFSWILVLVASYQLHGAQAHPMTLIQDTRYT